MKTRVYLDNCCYNRQFDDKTNEIVRLEAKATLLVQDAIRNGRLELAWSFVLECENMGNPHAVRRESIAPWKYIAIINVGANEEVSRQGHIVEKSGIRGMDALHVACAIKAGCRYFLTTDKKVLNKRVEGIAIMNPLDFVEKLEAEK